MNEFFKKWLNRIVVITVLLIGLGVGAYFLFHYTQAFLFTDNPRFVLTKENVTVPPPKGTDPSLLGVVGYGDFDKEEEREKIWRVIVLNSLRHKNLSADELHRMEQTTTAVNIFDIDINALRNSISRFSTIRSAEVERILPDKLVIRVVSRSPIAMLERPDGNYVCDADGMVMDRNQKEIPVGSLPVIVGIDRKNFRTGISIEDLVMPALHLIDYLSKNPDLGIRVVMVNVRDPDGIGMMSMTCFYRPDNVLQERKYRVDLPTDKRLHARLEELVEILRTNHRAPSQYNYIRMIYDGSVSQFRADPRDL